MVKVRPINAWHSTDENLFPSKTMITFYKTLQVIFCLDFGFFNYKTPKGRIYAKCFMLIYSLAFGVSSAICVLYYSKSLDEYSNIFYGFCILQYFLNVFIFIRGKNQFYSCLRKLGAIDYKLKVTSKIYNSDAIAVVTTVLLTFIFRSSIALYDCFIHDLSLTLTWEVIFYINLLVSHDIILITNSFAFYSINRRLVNLLSNMESDSTRLVAYLNIYKSIADIAENIKMSFDALFLVALLFNIPEIMSTIYYVVRKLQDHHLLINSGELQIEYVLATVTLILTIAPALCACKLSTVANKINVVLHDQWLLEQDPMKAKAIVKFIDYVEARPLIFYVYKVIPLNMHLLGTVLNFCVTYLIVIVQFTHLD